MALAIHFDRLIRDGKERLCGNCEAGWGDKGEDYAGDEVVESGT
jgi:hypothetical protein